MITLTRLTVTNFRSIGEAVFEPLTDGGLTAVTGTNGAGKSTLVNALVWALYGVTPDGVPNSALRRQNSDGEVKVVVEFHHNNENVTVERGFKGNRDSVYTKIGVDGIEQTFGKVRESQAWVTARFGGLDAKGFLTAFVIRQKELDDLVKAVPAKRRELIERLAGIDRMSAAVREARTEESEARKRIEMLPGSPATLQQAEEALEEAKADAADADSEHQTASSHLTDEDARNRAAQTRYSEHQAAKDAYTSAQTEHERAGYALRAAQDAHDTAAKAYSEASAAAESVDSGQYEEAQQNLQRLQQHYQQLSHATQSAQATQKSLMSATRGFEKAEAGLDRARLRVEEAEEALFSLREEKAVAEEAAPDLTSLQNDLAALQNRKGAISGQIETVSANINAFTGDQEHAACPTCRTEIEDPAVLVAELESEHARLEEQAIDLAASIDETSTEVDIALREREHYSQLAGRLSRAEKDLSDAEAALKNAETHHAETETFLHEAATAHETAVEERDHLSGSTPTPAQIKAAEELYSKLAAARSKAGSLEELRAKADETAQAVREAEERIASKEQAMTAAGYDQAAAAAAQKAAEEASVSLDEAKKAEYETRSQVAVMQERCRSAEANLGREKQYAKDRVTAVENYGRKAVVRETVEQFRKDRIASLAPELSEIATDSISKMTDGKYVSVDLDEEFTAVVTDEHGVSRPAAWLSGGEESMVALALRLAIGDVISGSQGGLLWMDEPQTAMDQQRRPAMMSVIRELQNRQPIMISHVSEATDMADMIVNLVPDAENGSTVHVETSAGDLSSVEALAAI